jgi:hypothetical protein
MTHNPNAPRGIRSHRVLTHHTNRLNLKYLINEWS